MHKRLSIDLSWNVKQKALSMQHYYQAYQSMTAVFIHLGLELAHVFSQKKPVKRSKRLVSRAGVRIYSRVNNYLFKKTKRGTLSPSTSINLE